MAWNHTAYHTNKSDIGHTRLKLIQFKYIQIALVSLSRGTDEKEKEKKKRKRVLRYMQTRNVLSVEALMPKQPFIPLSTWTIQLLKKARVSKMFLIPAA